MFKQAIIGKEKEYSWQEGGGNKNIHHGRGMVDSYDSGAMYLMQVFSAEEDELVKLGKQANSDQ